MQITPAAPRVNVKGSFLTGSQVYGIPRPDSDIDMVVFFERRSDYWKLSEFAGPINPSNHPSASDEEACPSLYIGRLNIVPVFTQELFQAWYDGTEFLKKEAPVPKPRCVQVMEHFRKKAREKQVSTDFDDFL